jgi:quercetin dioxygenase-like cupin family protein
VKVLPEGPSAPAGARPATALLHDEPNVRVVAFHVAPGQEIPPHKSPSTVLVHVVQGRGRFRGEDGEAELEAGRSAVYAPGELHAIAADDEPLSFLAIIAPRPS